MKFSVLLPTRNRLSLLKHAIESVLKQNESDFEVIVSDNYSDEDIQSYIKTLNDSRIKYFRTHSFVSVTENWNHALDRSSGDWIIMLGDDDCLMKGYFSTMRKLLENFSNPDFIYTHGFLFAYPKVLPQFPQGVARTASNSSFFVDNKEPGWLSHEEALRLVKDTFNFRCVFSFNMQFALFNRSFIEKLKKEDKFFHSPYPDYYAMTSAMLKGKQILFCPYPLVGVGISPKSFGYYYFNNIESAGVDFLNNSTEKEVANNIKKQILPGSDMNSCWLLSLQKIVENFDTPNLNINYQRYKLLQIAECLKQYLIFNLPKNDFKKALKRFETKEKILYGLPGLILKCFPLTIRRIFMRFFISSIKSHISYPFSYLEGEYSNIQQFFEQVDPFNLKYL